MEAIIPGIDIHKNFLNSLNICTNESVVLIHIPSHLYIGGDGNSVGGGNLNTTSDGR